MTFEEDFPSLKDKGTVFKRFDGVSPEKYNTTYRFANTWKAFTETNIQNNCLDKAKVKEAIDNLNKKIQSHIDLVGNSKKSDYDFGSVLMAQHSQAYLRQFKKELGLKLSK